MTTNHFQSLGHTQNHAISGKVVRPHSYQKQGGAALMVALILILMMTVMGMSTLRETSLEKRMTTNAVQKSITFQTAESTANRVSESTNNLLQALNGNGAEIEIYRNTTASGILETGHATYIGKSNASGYSLGNSGGFQSLAFRVRGKSSHDVAEVSSDVFQGIVRLAPQ